MGRSGRRKTALRILWEFRVEKDRVREFEEQYGANGTSARFFSRGKGYRETILLRDREVPGRYLTIDKVKPPWWDEPMSTFLDLQDSPPAEAKRP